MYKTASDNRQTALHRGRVGDWVNGEYRSSLADQQDAMRRAIAATEAAILRLPVDSPERKELGLKKLELQGQVSEINKQIKRNDIDWRSLAEFFRDEARSILTKTQYGMIMSAARRAMARERAANGLDEAAES